MSSETTAAARVTEIVALLRPQQARKLPESLTAAATTGDLERMQLFLDRGGKAAGRWQATGPSASGRMSMISHAAGHGIGEIVIALCDAGAALDPDDGAEPPLSRAAGEAHVDVVRILLERGASPNGPDGHSWLPLASAAQSGEPEVVRLLLEAGANPRAKPAGGAKLPEYARGPFAQEIRAVFERASGVRGTGKAKRNT